VDLALERIAPDRALRIADLGTGSGAIALALKQHRPRATVIGVDASAAALEVARHNATRLGLEVEFRHGCWFDPLAEERCDLVVANPPYVAAADPHLAQGDLRFEPREALASGVDGLDAIRQIVSNAPAHLVPGGVLLLEHGAGQDRAVLELLIQAGLEADPGWRDLAGIMRVAGGAARTGAR